MCTNLSKSILTAKIPRANGKAVNKCPALGYSTPGAVSAKSAQVTLCGSQNLSFQNQAEKAAMFFYCLLFVQNVELLVACFSEKTYEMTCRT